ncbi:4'-phosphopantetheinyl transferase family protein [Bacillus halotolerans]|uniref:4'-phosphopantetheinyl transferase n=1 Tax=Bacillus halotolerans TaxID=260554 RepID=A0A9Q6F120_9BACI|nr:4'-phosphopantetheinyl transferase superfamily protein [Bacillus halotolerans]MEC1602212.1 4'-phosphopantetheinyl transferase superfamily protein [Bacillus halotolerans]PLS05464.1 4'-phosphopantetheinyl transferase [Bacillus halotolerans]
MKIYGIYMDRPLSQAESDRLMSFVSAEKREKCRRFYHKEDAHRTLLGDVLVRSVISEQYQLNKADIRFSAQEYGKPCIPDLPNAHFNISHSGHWVIGAFDSDPIGVDIEKMKPISLGIAERFFSKKEYSDLLSKHKDEQNDYFYHLWSMKESFIKQEGKGLSLPLDSFSVRLHEDGRVSVELKEHHTPCFIKTYEVDPGYKMAVCAARPDFPEDITMISYEALL